MISKRIREIVYHKYNGHCAYCGCEIEYKDMQIDHIIPKCRNNEVWVSEIGSDDISNLNPSCRICNYYKGMRSVDIFRERLKDTLMRNVKNHLIFALQKGMEWLRLTSGMGNFTLKDMEASFKGFRKAM